MRHQIGYRFVVDPFRNLFATDGDLLTEFGCPVFRGCIICVTGLESDERREIRMLADENGETAIGVD